MKNIILQKIILFILISLLPITGFSEVKIEPSEILLDEVVKVRAGGDKGWKFDLEGGDKLVLFYKLKKGIVSKNKLTVHLVDMDNYYKYQNSGNYNYYTGEYAEVKGKSVVKYDIPRSANYYIIISNKKAMLLAKKIKVKAYLFRNKTTSNEERIQNKIEEEYRKIKNTYLFDGFDITIKSCGFSNAFSDPNITLCYELIHDLGRNNASEALNFIFHHELAHTLLKLWGYPLFDNEDAADEMAIVLSYLDDKSSTRHAIKAAEWFYETSSMRKVKAKYWVDDRHTISPQRARNITRWANNADELVGKWQKILLPNMTEKALNKHKKSIDKFFDPKEIVKELSLRHQ